MSKCILLCMAMACTSAVLASQIAHVALTTPPLIQPLYHDAARDSLVCWAPFSTPTLVWELGPTGWTSMAAPNGIPGLFFESVAFDSVRRRFVALNQVDTMTWEFDGTAWTAVTYAPVVPRWSTFPHANNYQMTYHETRQRVMLFHGSALYEWDGVAWTQVAANGPPSFSGPHSPYVYGPLVYDPRRDSVVLFGGYAVTPTEPAGTWEWDGANQWVFYPGFVRYDDAGVLWFDRQRGLMLRSFTNYNPTVHWIHYRSDNGVWQPLQTTPLPVLVGAYDPNHGRYFSFDNSGATIWSDTQPAQFTSHQPACPAGSTAGLDLAAPWTRGWLGGTLTTSVTTSSAMAILTMGFTDQTWSGGTLPLNLTPYGIAGCFLHTSPDAAVFAVGQGGRVSFAVPMPMAQGLLGLPFFQQAFAVDPAANLLGLLPSDSHRGTIGRRF